ncbi:hypothetical protein T11_1227 [Trichinella zimbabwensis]|uniref:Reverse transcriptase RNase H-like domain-containing protein n=1 Tax=Trichinella zimbabwensis TaxID=268475 RepID=A0A0V1HVD1_9BILA|nr:hypothetical protein T11_1227 [Trichinella zimbabwensis]
MVLDASKEAQKAMLSYECDEGKPRVTAFACRTVSKQERNCCSTRCEMLALDKKFKASTDHNSLRWVPTFKELECQIAWQLEKQLEYEFQPGLKYSGENALLLSSCRQCGIGNEVAVVPVRTIATVDHIIQDLGDGETTAIRKAAGQRHAAEFVGTIRPAEDFSTRSWKRYSTEESTLQAHSRNLRICLQPSDRSQSGRWEDFGETMPKVLLALVTEQCGRLVPDLLHLHCPWISDEGVACLSQIKSFGFPFQRVGMDLLEPPEETAGQSFFATTFPCGWTQLTAEAQAVASTLVNGIFCHYAMGRLRPCILTSEGTLRRRR